MSGLSRVRTELLRLAVVVALSPHPVQMYRQLPRHRYLGDLTSTPHGEMEKLAAPLVLTAWPSGFRPHRLTVEGFAPGLYLRN
jgi:hypothetical protein